MEYYGEMNSYQESTKTSNLTFKISKRIIMLREERGMTSEQLAHSIGLSKSGLRYIERAMKSPRIETLELISRGLNISLKELFHFEEN